MIVKCSGLGAAAADHQCQTSSFFQPGGDCVSTSLPGTTALQQWNQRCHMLTLSGTGFRTNQQTNQLAADTNSAFITHIIAPVPDSSQFSPADLKDQCATVGDFEEGTVTFSGDVLDCSIFHSLC